MQIVLPPDFVIKVKKERSVAFKIRQNPFSADPVGETHNAPPNPLVGWGGDTPPIPHPTRHRPTFGARYAFPEFQPDLRLCLILIYRHEAVFDFQSRMLYAY